MTIKTLFVDVGGVLLTNGWDRELRHSAALDFSLDPEEFEERHRMVFFDYETGKISLDAYLRHVIFFRQRPFSIEEFKKYIYGHSKAYPEMIDLIKLIKSRLKIKVAVLSNEGREIAVYRFRKFGFEDFIDYFVVSGFVSFCKPDLRIYHLALGLCQNEAREVLYIDDRKKLIEAGGSLGIQTIWHTSYESTRHHLSALFPNALF